MGSSFGRRPRLLRLDSLPNREMGVSLVDAMVEAAKARKEKINRPDMVACSRKIGRGEMG